MQDKSPADALGGGRYTAVAMVLHWAIAALILFELGLGLRMEHAAGPLRFAVFQLHKSVGITILLLALIRVLWRLTHRPPTLEGAGWEKALAHGVHGLLYLAMLALPLSGWVMISSSRIVVPTLLYGTVPWPHLPGFAEMAAATRDGWHSAGEGIHITLAYGLMAMIALHLAGALKHHVIDRSDILARMAPGAVGGRLGEPRLWVIAVAAVLAAGLGYRWWQVAPPAPSSPVVAPVATPVPEPVASDTPDPAPTAEATQAAAVEVPTWAIAPSSTLQFHTTWSGDKVNGGFKRFTGTIAFSPDALEQSHVEMHVDTASVFSGDAQRDETLKSADWFSSASFAQAVFKASRFRQTSPGHYLAKGTLKLKGVTMPVELPFTLTITGKHASMHGTATLDRTAFKIGEGDYAGTAEIPAAVGVDVAIEATQK